MSAPTLFAVVGLLAMAALPAAAGESSADRKSVAVSADVRSRTSLTVSARVVEFEVRDPYEESVAVVEFAAGARTRAGEQVVLTVEPLRAVEGPGGAGDPETSLSFRAEGDGTTSGTFGSAPAVAARWTGSGKRAGRLFFSLRASAPGRYSLPLRFVLTVP